jgi:hypothetical protein
MTSELITICNNMFANALFQKAGLPWDGDRCMEFSAMKQDWPAMCFEMETR